MKTEIKTLITILHINLFNFAKFTMQDGTEKTFAVDPEDLFKAQKTLSAKLNNKLAYRLSEHFDISIEQKNETIKVKGIDDEHINQFSSRKEEVLNEFKKQQEKKHNENNGEGKIYTSESQLKHDFQEHERAKYLESIRKGTAKPKEELSYNKLMKHFDNLIQTETDLTFDKIKESKIHSKLSDDEITKQIIKIMDDLTSNNAEFTQQQFDKAVYQEFAGKILIDDAAKFIEKHLPEQHKPIELENKNFTTKDAAIKSFETIALIEKLKDKSFDAEIFNTSKMNYRNVQQVVDVFDENLQKKNKSFKLNEFQKKAMVIATNNKAISHITGDAGTGKTSTVIKFANSIYSVDRDVYGLSTQTSTAESLTEAGIKEENTFNLTNFFSGIESNKLFIKPNSVLIIDEAGMVGLNHYNKLLKLTEEKNLKLILVGDSKQLASVSYGDVFKQIEEKLDDTNKARLLINQRQQTPEQQAIAEGFRDLNAEQALDTLKNTGCLKATDTKQEALNKLADDYINSTSKTKLAIAFKNDDINYLNDSIRTKLIENKELDASNQKEFKVLTSSSSKKATARSFCVDDKIVITKNMKAIKTKDFKQEQVSNSTVATITKIDNNKIHCLDGNKKEFIINTEKFNNFSHAYAVTTYKSQGQTVDESFIFSDGRTTSNQSYVDFSRHKHKTTLYIEESKLDDFKKNSMIKQEKTDLTKSAICQKIYDDKLKADALAKSVQEEAIVKAHIHTQEKEQSKPIITSIIDEKSKALQLDQYNKNCTELSRLNKVFQSKIEDYMKTYNKEVEAFKERFDKFVKEHDFEYISKNGINVLSNFETLSSICINKMNQPKNKVIDDCKPIFGKINKLENSIMGFNKNAVTDTSKSKELASEFSGACREIDVLKKLSGYVTETANYTLATLEYNTKRSKNLKPFSSYEDIHSEYFNKTLKSNDFIQKLNDKYNSFIEDLKQKPRLNNILETLNKFEGSKYIVDNDPHALVRWNKKSIEAHNDKLTQTNTLTKKKVLSM